jgi:L-ascorbate metabolism protein UlaG (beta-lactamase superfamily)
VKPPRKGINKILLTHEHDDHFSSEKIQKIGKQYIREDQDLKIYGPKSTVDKIALEEPIVVGEGDIIELENGQIKVFNVDCWGSDSCVAYLIEINGERILHTADSANYSESLKKIDKEVDTCFVACFEDYYKDYLEFINTIGPKLTIPYHFGPDEEEMGKNLAEYLKERDVNVKYLSPGETVPN